MVVFTLDRPQCITIQDGVAIDKQINELTSSLSTTCSRLVTTVKPEKAMRTHPDIGCKQTSLLHTCVFLAVLPADRCCNLCNSNLKLHGENSVEKSFSRKLSQSVVLSCTNAQYIKTIYHQWFSPIISPQAV